MISYLEEVVQAHHNNRDSMQVVVQISTRTSGESIASVPALPPLAPPYTSGAISTTTTTNSATPLQTSVFVPSKSSARILTIEAASTGWASAVTLGSSGVRFAFDAVFAETHTHSVYPISVFPKVKAVLDGRNSFVVAYGQTGIGKSYAMGIEANSRNQTGFVYQALHDIFASKHSNSSSSSLAIEISLLEIYNEDIWDLLDPRVDQDIPEQVVVQNIDGADIEIVGASELLVGNAFDAISDVLLIAFVSPFEFNLRETLRTLKFCNKVAKLQSLRSVVDISKHEDTHSHELNSLKELVARLKHENTILKGGVDSKELLIETESLRNELERKNELILRLKAQSNFLTNEVNLIRSESTLRVYNSTSSQIGSCDFSDTESIGSTMYADSANGSSGNLSQLPMNTRSRGEPRSSSSTSSYLPDVQSRTIKKLTFELRQITCVAQEYLSRVEFLENKVLELQQLLESCKAETNEQISLSKLNEESALHKVKMLSSKLGKVESAYEGAEEYINNLEKELLRQETILGQIEELEENLRAARESEKNQIEISKILEVQLQKFKAETIDISPKLEHEQKKLSASNSETTILFDNVLVSKVEFDAISLRAKEAEAKLAYIYNLSNNEDYVTSDSAINTESVNHNFVTGIMGRFGWTDQDTVEETRKKLANSEKYNSRLKDDIQVLKARMKVLNQNPPSEKKKLSVRFGSAVSDAACQYDESLIQKTDRALVSEIQKMLNEAYAEKESATKEYEIEKKQLIETVEKLETSKRFLEALSEGHGQTIVELEAERKKLQADLSVASLQIEHCENRIAALEENLQSVQQLNFENLNYIHSPESKLKDLIMIRDRELEESGNSVKIFESELQTVSDNNQYTVIMAKSDGHSEVRDTQFQFQSETQFILSETIATQTDLNFAELNRVMAILKSSESELRTIESSYASLEFKNSELENAVGRLDKYALSFLKQSLPFDDNEKMLLKAEVDDSKSHLSELQELKSKLLETTGHLAEIESSKNCQESINEYTATTNLNSTLESYQQCNYELKQALLQLFEERELSKRLQAEIDLKERETASMSERRDSAVSLASELDTRLQEIQRQYETLIFILTEEFGTTISELNANKNQLAKLLNAAENALVNERNELAYLKQLSSSKMSELSICETDRISAKLNLEEVETALNLEKNPHKIIVDRSILDISAKSSHIDDAEYFENELVKFKSSSASTSKYMEFERSQLIVELTNLQEKINKKDELNSVISEKYDYIAIICEHLKTNLGETNQQIQDFEVLLKSNKLTYEKIINSLHTDLDELFTCAKSELLDVYTYLNKAELQENSLRSKLEKDYEMKLLEMQRHNEVLCLKLINEHQVTLDLLTSTMERSKDLEKSVTQLEIECNSAISKTESSQLDLESLQKDNQSKDTQVKELTSQLEMAFNQVTKLESDVKMTQDIHVIALSRIVIAETELNEVNENHSKSIIAYQKKKEKLEKLHLKSCEVLIQSQHLNIELESRLEQILLQYQILLESIETDYKFVISGISKRLSESEIHLLFLTQENLHLKKQLENRLQLNATQHSHIHQFDVEVEEYSNRINDLEKLCESDSAHDSCSDTPQLNNRNDISKLDTSYEKPLDIVGNKIVELKESVLCLGTCGKTRELEQRLEQVEKHRDTLLTNLEGDHRDTYEKYLNACDKIEEFELRLGRLHVINHNLINGINKDHQTTVESFLQQISNSEKQVTALSISKTALEGQLAGTIRANNEIVSSLESELARFRDRSGAHEHTLEKKSRAIQAEMEIHYQELQQKYAEVLTQLNLTHTLNISHSKDVGLFVERPNSAQTLNASVLEEINELNARLYDVQAELELTKFNLSSKIEELDSAEKKITVLKESNQIESKLQFKISSLESQLYESQNSVSELIEKLRNSERDAESFRALWSKWDIEVDLGRKKSIEIARLEERINDLLKQIADYREINISMKEMESQAAVATEKVQIGHNKKVALRNRTEEMNINDGKQTVSEYFNNITTGSRHRSQFGLISELDFLKVVVTPSIPSNPEQKISEEIEQFQSTIELLREDLAEASQNYAILQSEMEDLKGLHENSLLEIQALKSKQEVSFENGDSAEIKPKGAGTSVQNVLANELAEKSERVKELEGELHLARAIPGILKKWEDAFVVQEENAEELERELEAAHTEIERIKEYTKLSNSAQEDEIALLEKDLAAAHSEIRRQVELLKASNIENKIGSPSNRREIVFDERMHEVAFTETVLLHPEFETVCAELDEKNLLIAQLETKLENLATIPDILESWENAFKAQESDMDQLEAELDAANDQIRSLQAVAYTASKNGFSQESSSSSPTNHRDMMRNISESTIFSSSTNTWIQSPLSLQPSSENNSFEIGFDPQTGEYFLPQDGESGYETKIVDSQKYVVILCEHIVQLERALSESRTRIRNLQSQISSLELSNSEASLRASRARADLIELQTSKRLLEARLERFRVKEKGIFGMFNS
ncbi:hypothetical protein HK100_002251 [Physocladia obscura]|uniref:Kinesin motor domain-containing protein n=1 Tax=Physocladia obscura TaxID=109957 RepID=A0AAD5XK18_9FUNG|nr:hypothetical protein HK100_002251 [Physocladia obscura]